MAQNKCIKVGSYSAAQFGMEIIVMLPETPKLGISRSLSYLDEIYKIYYEVFSFIEESQNQALPLPAKSITHRCSSTGFIRWFFTSGKAVTGLN